jgi:hypothetical protein
MKPSLVIGVLSLTFVGPAVAASSIDWAHQFGTGGYDQAFGVSADGLGNVYVSGITDQFDAYVAKFSDQGVLQWFRPSGFPGEDRSYSVSADVLGNVYISGFTYSDVAANNAARSDVFVSKYDANGALQWTGQLGTNNSSSDFSFGVSADGLGNVYVAGATEGGDLDGTGVPGQNPFVTKFNSGGILQWTHQIRSREGSANAVSADGMGNVYLSGTMVANDFGMDGRELDAFLSKYAEDGTLQWTRQLGTNRDEYGWGVTADKLGNVFMWGYTTGDLAAPSTSGNDAFISKYDAQGQLQWTRQLGTFSFASSFGGVSADGLGNVYFAGHTLRPLVAGASNTWDAFAGKYDGHGELVWIRQFGTSEIDDAYGVSWDGDSNLYVAGRSFGNLWGMNAGLDDAYLMKIRDVVPEPSSLLLVATVSLMSICFRNVQRWRKQSVQPIAEGNACPARNDSRPLKSFLNHSPP